MISARVAQVLAPSLEVFAGAHSPQSGLGGTRNTDAYQLYLAAARHAQDMRVDGLRKSIDLYKQALQVDPGYALAWVELAETYRRTLFGADAMPSEVFEPADFAVQRALAAVPNLAEARAERPSSSIGSTSIGPAPNASFEPRSRSIRTWPWPTSVWPVCC
jgi:hypothetical protein